MPANHDNNWSDLIADARTGNAAALATLFERSREPLLARIRWMMGDEARRLAESGDFLHETFAAALAALPGFELRGEGSYLSWLTTIARNKIRHEVRRHREAALSMLSSSIGNADVAQPEEPISTDTALSLMDALDRLPPEERRLIELRDLEGKTFAEIGALLGCSDRHAHRLHTKTLIHMSRHFRGRDGP